jgi:hypothetical protein
MGAFPHPKNWLTASRETADSTQAESRCKNDIFNRRLLDRPRCANLRFRPNRVRNGTMTAIRPWGRGGTAPSDLDKTDI